MSELEHSHEPDEVARRISGPTRHNYLADFVYGAIDGNVTTFAVVSGVAGAGLGPEIIVVLGLANLVGDGFSMAASNFLGTRTDQQLLQKARQMEARHIEADPEGEREEIRQIYASKGFAGRLLEEIVDVITSDRKRWIDTMLKDEFGLALHTPSALHAATVTFFAFLLIGFIPLLSFIAQMVYPFPISWAYLSSAVLAGIGFFLVGAAKSWFVEQKWHISGLETLAVGGTAAALAYVIGAALGHVIPT
ncbi:MAG: VIT1/CCC1 transporter family protein [Planctomycetota bacterium]